MANCAICGKELQEVNVTTLQCPDQASHQAGEPRVGSAHLECPLKKGAIWVYITDDSGKALKRIPVKVPKAPDPNKSTDNSGFSSFDPLDPGSDYTVEIDTSSVEPEHYPPRRKKIEKITVRNGEITSVEFKLERIAPLKVIVDYPESFPGKPEIKVAGASNEFNPAHGTQEIVNGLTFPRLRRHDYQVNLTLTAEQKKKYRIVEGHSKNHPHDPYGDNEVRFKVIALKLIRLEVIDAKPLDNGNYWRGADPVKKVRVRAVTEPDDADAWAQLHWEGGAPSNDKHEAEVAITNTGDFKIKATLDVEKSTIIEVYDIVKVECAELKDLGASKWKAYKSDTKTAKLKVTTKPDEERVWKHLKWSKGAPALAKTECAVDLKPVGDLIVQVYLDTEPFEIKPLDATLHICQWPRLEVAKVSFDCHKVLNDGAKEFGRPFDGCWSAKGRKVPAPHVPAASSQSPVCFTRDAKVKVLTVDFEITVDPTEEETVTIRGSGVFGELRTDLKVKPGAGYAVTADIESTGTLQDYVDFDDAWKIDWEHLLEDAITWADAKASTHLLYVLLGDPAPNTEIYFTLLHLSCLNALAENDENGLVSESFDAFKGTSGNGNGLRRKGDNVELSYYKQGIDTAANDTTFTGKGILSNVDGTGRCGGWAQLLVHMWKIHGVTTANVRSFLRAIEPGLQRENDIILVKNLDFTLAPAQPGLYTYQGVEAAKLPGVPGQGKDNPQFLFGDHAVVKHGGLIYDPSYGIGPYNDDAGYLDDALDGLGSTENGDTTFQMGDGTWQSISEDCVPYADGFAEYTISTEDMDDIAAIHGVTAQELLDDDPDLLALAPTLADVARGDKLTVQTLGGDIVYVLVDLTIDEIAAAHGVTKQAIFNDPANAAIQFRGSPDNLEPGDIVLVTSAVVPNGQWVFGHDT